MTRAALLAVMLAALSGCIGASRIVPQGTPSLGSGLATTIVESADEVRTAAFADGRVDDLSSAFRGRALNSLSFQVARFAQHGLELQEQDRTLRLAAWDSRASEAVLEVAARHRLVSPRQPDPAWAPTVRQWWARLAYAGGRWWVIDQEDLPPDQWRPVTASS